MGSPYHLNDGKYQNPPNYENLGQEYADIYLLSLLAALTVMHNRRQPERGMLVILALPLEVEEAAYASIEES
jgi:hypothetical protein